MTGPLYTALTALVAQLAAAPAFAERCLKSLELPDDPTKHIYLNEALVAEGGAAYDNTMDKRRPFAVIVEGEDSFRQVSQGVSVGMVGSVTLYVLFTDIARATEDSADPNASKLDFVSFVSETLQWIAEHNGTGDYLVPWSTIAQVDNYERTPIQDRGDQDHWAVVYSFQAGVPNA